MWQHELGQTFEGKHGDKGDSRITNTYNKAAAYHLHDHPYNYKLLCDTSSPTVPTTDF